MTNAQNFYVASNGKDSDPGTIRQPFATLLKARDAARRLGKDATKKIVVRGGDYFNVCLLLESPLDNNLTIVGYPGEEARLYGGQLLTGWTRINDRCYMAKLPLFPTESVPAGINEVTNWLVRMLLVDEKNCARARYPVTGKLYYARSSDGGNTVYYTNDLPPLNISNAEVSVDHSWDESTVGISAMDLARKTMTLNPAVNRGLGYTGVRSYAIYNVTEGMTRPGQFVHDRVNNAIMYWPLPSQNPNEVQCIVPTTSRLFFLKGNVYEKLHNVTLSNLHLAVTTVSLTTGGDNATRYSGAVTAQWSEGCQLLNLRIGPAAAHAFSSDGVNSERLRIANCEVLSCGAGGICAHYTLNTVISNNWVHDVGLMFGAAVGSRGGYGSDSVIVHNAFENCSGAGIHLDYAHQSSIVSNIVQNCMTSLRDGGGIYSYSCSNLNIRGNYVATIGGTNLFNNDLRDGFLFGIYLDQLTRNAKVEGNLVYDVPQALMHHQANGNAWLNNFFISPREGLTMHFAYSPNGDCIFERNLIWSTAAIKINGPEVVRSWSKNLFFSLRDQTNGLPAGVVIANPRFRGVEPPRLDLPENSPAIALGIEPVFLPDADRIPNRNFPPAPGKKWKRITQENSSK